MDSEFIVSSRKWSWWRVGGGDRDWDRDAAINGWQLEVITFAL